MKKIIYLLLIPLFFSCNKLDLQEEPVKKDYTEQLVQEQLGSDTIVYTNGSYTIVMNKTEFSDILVTQDLSAYKTDGYHIPTYEEVKLLKTISYTTKTNQRLLCVKNNIYYTYLFNNTGSISKAGTKTKYSILLIKVLKNETQFEITI